MSDMRDLKYKETSNTVGGGGNSSTMKNLISLSTNPYKLLETIEHMQMTKSEKERKE